MDDDVNDALHAALSQLTALRVIVELLLANEIKKASHDTAAQRLDGLWKSLSEDISGMRLPNIPEATQNYAAQRIADSLDEILGNVRRRLEAPES